MKQYNVTGMSCAACAAHVERAARAVPGVTECSVSLLTGSMRIEGNASDDAVIAAVTAAGYGASAKKTADTPVSDAAEEALKDRETPLLKRQLLASLGFLLPLMYLSMGHVMWGFPLPAPLAHNPRAIALAEMLLTAIVLVINQKFFINGFKGLMRRAPSMDTLVALGSAAAFIYSTGIVFSMTGDTHAGNADTLHHMLHNLYFESAAMILTLITVGKMLEARSKGKTTDALRGLMRLTPKTARIVREGIEEEVPISQVKRGDIFVVRPGESIPCDGIVTEGNSAVNEAALTGESIPVDKAVGDSVYAATGNTHGLLFCEATRVGEDTTLAQIIQMVSDAAATKAPIAKTADRVSGIFVPLVMGIALLTMCIWMMTGATLGHALSRGISVLVISCPCALGLATPVAIMVGSGVGAKNGILFKTAASLEAAGKARIVALDKTGTITKGEPQVTDTVCADGITENDLLSTAFIAEHGSEHPLAKAIIRAAEAAGLGGTVPAVSDFRILPGNGLECIHDGQHLIGGSLSYIKSTHIEIPKQILSDAERFSKEGKTPLLFTRDDRLLGLIAVADVIKDDSAQAISQLREMGIRVIMLTGDNRFTAEAIGSAAGVDEVIADVHPDEKEAVIRSLKEHCGKQELVAMVGDGINDAPALTRADVGIAIGAGADIAVDAADIVLMKSRLSDVPAAIRLSRAVLRNIHENLFWAFGYNLIGIPLAAGAFAVLMHWEMDPMFGAAAMSISSFLVVTNALRLNLLDIHKHRISAKSAPQDLSPIAVTVQKDGMPQIIQNKKEKKEMTVTLKIEGMMCPRCEAHVKKALEALEHVTEAIPDHTAGTAVVKASSPIPEDVLRTAVEDAGYTFLGLQ